VNGRRVGIRARWWVFGLIGSLAVGLVAAGAIVVAPPLDATSPPTRPTPLNVVIPIYNDRGLHAVRTHLRPHLRRGDTFLLISGNQDDEIDPAWLDLAAEELRTFYPSTTVLAGTSGIANVRVAVAGIEPPVEGLVYIYEPNFANEPEFSWDFATTQRLFDQVADLVRDAGLRVIGKPTGRPLLAPSLSRLEWNYRELRGSVDELFIQTQAYCEVSVAQFEAAIQKLVAQFGGGSRSELWLPQLTLDLNSPHGVSVARALACAEVAKGLGVDRFLMWWSPTFAAEAAVFLERVRP
jgi:hypothetical protein